MNSSHKVNISKAVQNGDCIYITPDAPHGPPKKINTSIFKLCQKNLTKYIPINKFQKVYRDLSILIDEQITLSDIINATKNVKTNLLQDISLFDIYRDKKQFVDKKAYGLRFQFLHPKRTLTDKEVDKVMLQIQYSILKETNGQLR